MVKRALTIAIVMICVLFQTLGVWSYTYSPANEVEAKEIRTAVQHAYDMLAVANETGNLAVLDDALIDHVAFLQAIGPERQQQLQNSIREILGLDVGSHFGYLTAMRNKMTLRLQGRKLLLEAMAKAKAEQRELTSEELQVLQKQNQGERPTLPNPHLPSKRVIAPEQYQSIEISGDQARAYYDDGIRYETALLVRINGRWYVAGIF